MPSSNLVANIHTLWLKWCGSAQRRSFLGLGWWVTSFDGNVPKKSTKKYFNRVTSLQAVQNSLTFSLTLCSILMHVALPMSCTHYCQRYQYIINVIFRRFKAVVNRQLNTDMAQNVKLAINSFLWQDLYLTFPGLLIAFSGFPDKWWPREDAVDHRKWRKLIEDVV